MTERIFTSYSQTFAGLLTDPMGELVKESHMEAAAAAREQDYDPGHEGVRLLTRPKRPALVRPTGQGNEDPVAVYQPLLISP